MRQPSILIIILGRPGHPKPPQETYAASHPAGSLPGQATTPAPTPATAASADATGQQPGPTREGPDNNPVVHGRLQRRYLTLPKQRTRPRK